MSVLNYLDNLATKAVLKEEELTSIRTSILNLKSNLKCYFGDEIQESFQFVSSKRETILPRKFRYRLYDCL